MTDNVKNQMRPIARNLKAPALPKFVQEPQKHHQQESRIPAAFKTNVLAFHSLKKIRISHFENGPFMFCVQMESADKDFQRMNERLQKTDLRRLAARPTTIGMACLALHDKKVFRVAIARVPHHPPQDDYFVNFVDYGFNKSVRLENLCYIPDDFINPFTFAMPFALAGCKVADLKVNDKEISFYFRQLTENQMLTLKCVPNDGPPICQYCELFTDDKVNILQKLRQWDPYDNMKFRPHAPLEMKITHDVKVSYVESAQEFYIHLQKEEILRDYDLTSDELFKMVSRSPVHRSPKVGSCCAVSLSGEHYRGLVVGSNKSNRTVQVKIVDFGIVEEIAEKHVHLLTEKFVEKPPQAHRVCLKGFEDIAVSENISDIFDIFCGDGRGERKVFKMTIVEKGEETYLVELEDFSTSPPVNVNKMLLKNSRPLIETIQLENAKKRQKDSRNFGESFEGKSYNDRDRDRNSSQRGRGNHTSKGIIRSSPVPAQPEQNRQQTHFDKGDNSSGVYRSKESSVHGSKESTPVDRHHSKSADREINNTKNQTTRNSKAVKQTKNDSKKTASDLKSGWVSTLLSINRAFVHYDEHVEGLEKILDEMFAFYENKNSRPLLKDLQIGAECAVRSNDGNWYRSRIESVNGDKVKVFHREYGNTEIVSKSKIRVLDEKFVKMNDLAVTTYFAIKPTTESDEKTLFNEMMKLFEDGAKEFSFKVIQKLNNGWILEPIDQNSGKKVFDDLVKAKKAQRVTDNELKELLEVKVPEKPSEKPKEVKDPKKERKSPEKAKKVEKKAEVAPEPKPEVAVSVTDEETSKIDPSWIPVRMTAVTSPTDFYISLVDEFQSFSQLHNDVQIIASGVAALDEFEEGTLCLAQQPFDSCWYRAKIIDSDEAEAEHNVMITVRCVDDGKTFSVEDKKFLKIMPAALQRKKFFGISCSLPVKLERKREEDVTGLMISMMENVLHVTFLDDSPDDCTSYVELFNDNENVTDLLVAKKFAHRLEMIQSGKCYTSHINSATSFYLQFEVDQLKLDLISQYFEEAKGKFEKCEGKAGDIVAALFPDDSCWYRARIESVESDGYTVTFIDYGNTCLVKEIGEIVEPAMRELKAMSQHCTLKRPKDINCFSEAAEMKFIEICANGATILEVRSLPVNPGEAAEVELFLDSQNISDDLFPLCDSSDHVDHGTD